MSKTRCSGVMEPERVAEHDERRGRLRRRFLFKAIISVERSAARNVAPNVECGAAPLGP